MPQENPGKSVAKIKFKKMKVKTEPRIRRSVVGRGLIENQKKRQPVSQNQESALESK